MVVKEIKSKSILSKSGIPGVDFAINPYLGCLHSCVYCYARFMKKFTKHQEPWGEFCDVRINAPELLKKEVGKIPSNSSIFISSVTDPYQSLERKYQLTRKILEILAGYNFQVSILTKSNLILRDLDILKKIKNLEVGLTITTLDEKIQRLIEPRASSPHSRLETLKVFKEAGIKTYAFIGPILIGFTDLEKIFTILKNKVDYVFADTLNTKGQNWIGLERVLRQFYPKLLARYFENYLNLKNYCQYVFSLKSQLKTLSVKSQIPVKIVF